MRIYVTTAICALAIGGCTGPAADNQTNTAEGGNVTTEPFESVELADGATGIDSAGTRYDQVVDAQRTEGTAPGSEGSGETAELALSEAEVTALAALQPIEAPGAVVGIKTIHGTDDRKKISPTTSYPERIQVLIALPGGRCSGVLVGKNLVLTAGHCVHSASGWATGATVYPGYDRNTAPYGSCKAKKFYSVTGWTQNKNPAYDIGAIKLDCDIGTRVGWAGVFWQTASLMGKQARVSSYPGDKPLEQWGHTDKVRWETALQTGYLTDTMPGNSGSGVFAPAGGPAACKNACVHTVHAYGGSARNSGTRITQPLFNNIVKWAAE